MLIDLEFFGYLWLFAVCLITIAAISQIYVLLFILVTLWSIIMELLILFLIPFYLLFANPRTINGNCTCTCSCILITIIQHNVISIFVWSFISLCIQFIYICLYWYECFDKFIDIILINIQYSISNMTMCNRWNNAINEYLFQRIIYLISISIHIFPSHVFTLSVDIMNQL